MYESWGNAASRSYYEGNWYVYLLEGDGPEYYIGMTHNVKRRLQEHRRGDTPKTSKLKNIKLIGKMKVGDFIKTSKVERYLHQMNNPLDYFNISFSDLITSSSELEDSKMEAQVRWALGQAK